MMLPAGWAWFPQPNRETLEGGLRTITGRVLCQSHELMWPLILYFNDVFVETQPSLIVMESITHNWSIFLPNSSPQFRSPSAVRVASQPAHESSWIFMDWAWLWTMLLIHLIWILPLPFVILCLHFCPMMSASPLFAYRLIINLWKFQTVSVSGETLVVTLKIYNGRTP